VKRFVKTRGFDWSSLNRTSAVNVATKARDIGGTTDCTLAHSIKSFLFNALMSCSTESSRMGSGVMMVDVVASLEDPATVEFITARCKMILRPLFEKMG